MSGESYAINQLLFWKVHSQQRGTRGSVVIKALRYKPQTRGFETRGGN
jgi:hypothetical protein